KLNEIKETITNPENFKKVQEIISETAKKGALMFKAASPLIDPLTSKILDEGSKVAEKVGSTAYWESVDPATVEICKERQLRSLRSWTKERPDGVGDVMLAYLLNEDARLPTERIALAEMSDKNLLVSAVKGALQRARLSVYVHGNRGDAHTARETISSLGALLGKDMPLAEVEAHQNDYGWGLKDRILRARLIPMGKHHTEVLLDSFNPEDPNSALVLHLQTAMRSPATSALTIMLAQYLREPAFNELRTRRQLGYIVSTGAGGFGAQHHSMRGITVRVLSQRYGPHEMLTAVDEFLASQAETFAAITQDDLDSRTASVIRTLEDPPTAFSEEASSFWSAIVENQPFDWN
ncbi:hypothetical protein EBZ37_14950, partial [bacterium]|nr:hypothetical protein [bacterium]